MSNDSKVAEALRFRDALVGEHGFAQSTADTVLAMCRAVVAESIAAKGKPGCPHVYRGNETRCCVPGCGFVDPERAESLRRREPSHSPAAEAAGARLSEPEATSLRAALHVESQGNGFMCEAAFRAGRQFERSTHSLAAAIDPSMVAEALGGEIVDPPPPSDAEEPSDAELIRIGEEGYLSVASGYPDEDERRALFRAGRAFEAKAAKER